MNISSKFYGGVYMKELNLNDLDQVAGGMSNPWYNGYCYDCKKDVLVMRNTGECYVCHGYNTDWKNKFGNS